MIIGCCSHFGSKRQGVNVSTASPIHMMASRCQRVEDSRRQCTLGGQGSGMGELWLSNWWAAHSPWAEQFDLIINCCHQQFHRRRRPRLSELYVQMGEKMDVHTFQRAVKKLLRAMLEGRSSLVHCRQGKHCTGAFVVFTVALCEDRCAGGCCPGCMRRLGIKQPPFGAFPQAEQ